MNISKDHKAEILFFLERPLQNIYQHTTDEHHCIDEIQKGLSTDPKLCSRAEMEVSSNFYHFKPQLSLLICKYICKRLYNVRSNSFFYLAIYWVPMYVQSTVLEIAKCTYKNENFTMLKSTLRSAQHHIKSLGHLNSTSLVSLCAR